MDDTSAFRQQVRMATVQVTGLRPDELAAALAYEVEPFSGIPAADAELAYTPVAGSDPAVRVYEVAVRRRKSRASAGEERLLLPLLILGGFCLVLACIDFVYTSLRLRTAENDVASQSALQSRLDAIRKPAKAARAEANAIRARRENAAKAQKEAAAARSAYADIMDVVAAACGDKAVLKSIDGGVFSMRLTGVAVTASAAADVLVALSDAATRQGWRIVSGPIDVLTPGLTAEFKCELTHD